MVALITLCTHEAVFPRLLQSGIDIPEEIMAVYESVKLKHAHKYISFALEKTGEVGGKATYGFVITF